ncbi:IS1595 family transposase [Francisella tularensis subsp. novicida]|uniref:IS1595 family transposase n=1 Tax=Francisella tularensis TaxID=263 RepID=UPI000CE29269|nr:IS1595 family transposase [Francisella tularensis]AVC43292.1 IS1595 family transposase [Francisella tularensis subsp. novicida]AVC43375.1 IS1595 family transposase [Francisella tularensis subsp. novicida]AVC43700.1 IS1595 family transposase [Francisella tularensis subsp. novicida]AVC44916.1 IS1595 family transposase [Francisella tularensis subsp. novicida]
MFGRYKKRSHISDAKIREILKCFCLDLTATNTSKMTNISRITINRYFDRFRKIILLSDEKFFASTGEFELDESYFGAKRVRGKRGRGAVGKTPVFGVLKRNENNKVYVSIVPNCSKESLMPIIQGKILENSTIYTHGWKAYDGLILNGYDHYRIYHSHNEFARGKNYVNGIESFWSFSKRRLAKFNGLSDDKFVLHLKKCEFRWNNKDSDLYKIMCSLVRKFSAKVI